MPTHDFSDGPAESLNTDLGSKPPNKVCLMPTASLEISIPKGDTRKSPPAGMESHRITDGWV